MNQDLAAERAASQQRREERHGVPFTAPARSVLGEVQPQFAPPSPRVLASQINGAKGGKPVGFDREKLKAQVLELLAEDPEINMGAAFKRLNPPISKSYFKALMGRWTKGLRADQKKDSKKKTSTITPAIREQMTTDMQRANDKPPSMAEIAVLTGLVDPPPPATVKVDTTAGTAASIVEETPDFCDVQYAITGRYKSGVISEMVALSRTHEHLLGPAPCAQCVRAIGSLPIEVAALGAEPPSSESIGLTMDRGGRFEASPLGPDRLWQVSVRLFVERKHAVALYTVISEFLASVES